MLSGAREGECMWICSSGTFPYLVKCKRPDAVRGQLHRVQQRDLNESVRLRPSVGPVLVTLHLKHTQRSDEAGEGAQAFPISC